MLPADHDPPSSVLIAAFDQWLGAWRLAAALSWAGAATLVRLSDPQQLRKVWSANLTEIADRNLRSPEFIRLMACGLRTMADAARFTSALGPRQEISWKP